MPIIDLSAAIAPSPPDVAPYERVEVTYATHAQGAAQIEAFLGVSSKLLRNGEGWAIEDLRLSTHSVTHVDAPWHYNSVIQGQAAATIDQLPLEWFFAPGVVLDLTHKQDEELIDVADLQTALAAAGHALAPRDIVLLHTGRDRFYGRADYSQQGCAVTAAATHWLFDRGVRVMGIDAWGWDGPLFRQAGAAISADKPAVFWAAHQCNRPYCQIERLVNLAALPPRGFQVACFPLKVQGGSAGPARVVAILPD
jgi:kynurenine formamidase